MTNRRSDKRARRGSGAQEPGAQGLGTPTGAVFVHVPGDAAVWKFANINLCLPARVDYTAATVSQWRVFELCVTASSTAWFLQPSWKDGLGISPFPIASQRSAT